MSPVEISLGRTFAPLLFGTLLRSTLLALFCGVLVFLLRARPAAIRHSLWRGMLFALLLLPILQIVAPPLRPASPHLLSIAPPRVATTGLARWKPTIAVRPLEETGKQQHAWILILIAVYLGVTFLLCVRLMAGLHRLKVIARRSQFIGNAGFHELAHDTWLESGAFIIPRMRVSREVIVPIVIESAQEIFLLLPASWTEWDEGKLRLVLTHEMCHVRRGDPATALLASVATCLFWVHPLSWFLKRQLAYLAEEACDDAVLEAAPDPERYVRILLDFAREVVNRRARVLEPASAMVQGSQLRTRIQKIYAASELRRKRPRLIRAIAVALFVPALYVAAAARFDPPQQPATFSWPMTSEKAARLEAGLKANPEDLKTRERLLQWYFNTAQREALTRQFLWLIQHHPELAGMTAMLAPRGGRWNTRDDYQRLKSAW
ncbi:MAG TPA: M56 family metallopeptidase, partial [Bryobacteraceae bacterium]